MRIIILLTAVIYALIASGCKKMVDFYLGVPLQPVIDSNTFVPGLNIFGIIRPDSTGGYNNSYIMLQKVLPATGSDDSLEIDTAQVTVFYASQSAENVICNFLPSDCNGTFIKDYYRPLCEFHPQAGDTIKAECRYMDLPVLKGITIIPNKPLVLENTLIKTGNSVSFDIRYDSTIYMYDVYLYYQGHIVNYLRIPASGQSDTQIKFSSLSTDADSISIYGYDYNFAKYYLTSNTSLNFNKYRESYSTVEDGYGVFGSLNLAGYKIKKPL